MDLCKRIRRPGSTGPAFCCCNSKRVAELSSKIAKKRHSDSLFKDGPEYVYESRIVPYKVKTKYSGPTAGGDITKSLLVIQLAS